MLVGASDPDAMLAFTKQCVQSQIPFAADTSWQLARLDGEQVRSLITGADYLFCNEYEAELTEHKTGWSAGELNEQGRDQGDDARRSRRQDRPRRASDRFGCPPCPTAARRSPPARETRSAPDSSPPSPGASAWSAPRSSATCVAVHALETTGTQEYQLEPEPLAARFAAAYGKGAAAEVAGHYI